MIWIIAFVVGILFLIVVHDIVQRKHTILHNFPILGHIRYLMESIGPELRQYIVTANDEERPFSRDQRSWVYASSKRENNYFGFGTDNDLDGTSNYLILKQSNFPLTLPHPGDKGYDSDHPISCAKIMGAHRDRKKKFRPGSMINVSAMSYGSLGSRAVEAMNKGCALAGVLHNTGEGGVSDHHLHGGDLILQIGTGYFGARNDDGTFCMETLLARCEENSTIKAIEIKLSQGAKPGLGGLLPASKVTQEIAEARGIPRGEDCASPSGHSAFGDVDSMLDFIEEIATNTGLPVGIKSAVGNQGFWIELAEQVEKSNRAPDFITIDGGEGGSGAAPLAYADHVSLPFKIGFPRVFSEFSKRGIDEQIIFIGSGRLGFPVEALFAVSMGCDMISVAREAMLSIGCIQAQRCHTDICPAGIATHKKWLMAGLDPALKSVRLANYLCTLRCEMLKLSYSVGVTHPSEILEDHFEIINSDLTAT